MNGDGSHDDDGTRGVWRLMTKNMMDMEQEIVLQKQLLEAGSAKSNLSFEKQVRNKQEP